MLFSKPNTISIHQLRESYHVLVVCSFWGALQKCKLSTELSKALFHGDSSPLQQDSEPIQRRCRAMDGQESPFGISLSPFLKQDKTGIAPISAYKYAKPIIPAF